MLWTLSHRADDHVRQLADRHYSRQTVGSPKFVAPGRSLVLRSLDGYSYWVTLWPMWAKHAWNGAFVCTAFRREGGDALASDLIIDALKATRWKYPDVPDMGMVTFIDPGKVKPKKNPGFCFLKAGFEYVGKTKRNRLLVLQLKPENFPEAEPPYNARLSMPL